MMHGEQVTVITRHVAGRDEGNNDVLADDPPVRVDDVLVGPGATEDSTSTIRPNGVTVDATLHFPRTWQGPSLKDATITIRGHDYHVIGDPLAYDGGLTPTRWNMSVQVTRGAD